MKANLITKVLKSKAVKKVVKVLVDNAPKILTGVSIVSSVAATVFAVKGTVLAVRIIDDRNEKIKKGEIPVPEHPKWENVKAVWKCYIPTATCLCVSIGTSIKGMEISAARTAVATTACKLTEQAFEEYRNETIAKIGEEKEKEIRQNIAQRNADESGVQPVIHTYSSFDKVLIQDEITGQLFWGTAEDVKAAINMINYGFAHGHYDYMSVLEYADYLGVESHDEDRGWNVMDGLLEVKFDPGLTKDMRPCIVAKVTKPYEGYNVYR